MRTVIPGYKPTYRYLPCSPPNFRMADDPPGAVAKHCGVYGE
jgi:hypothetical protein